jgi:hypothetical protein
MLLFTHKIRIDNDVFAYVSYPFSTLLFIPAARQAQRIPYFHTVMFWAGMAGIPAFSFLGFHYFGVSQALIGVTGPFSGLGELLGSLVFFLLALISILSVVACGIGKEIVRK